MRHYPHAEAANAARRKSGEAKRAERAPGV